MATATTPEAIPESQPIEPSAPSPAWSPTPEPPLVNARWWIGLALGGAALVVLMLWGYSLMLQSQLSKMSVPEGTSTPRVVARTTSASPPSQAATTPTAASVAKPAVTAPRAVAPVTTPPTFAKHKRPDLTLNGIVEGRGEPLAIINGMILRIGDSVNGAILLEIRGEEARLRWREEELLLSTTR